MTRVVETGLSVGVMEFLSRVCGQGSNKLYEEPDAEVRKLRFIQVVYTHELPSREVTALYGF